MILDKVLILKGLGGLTVLGGSGLAVYFAVAPSDDDSSKAKKLKEDLGLPENDSDCKLPTNDNETTTCTLDTDKLKAIKFDGKNGDLTIESNGTVSVTLTITKVESSDSIFGTGGYKFAFQSDKDITISSTSPAKYIKKNTNTEFRIKETTPTNDSAKTLSLEKAWTVTKLAEKVGLTCSNESSCTPGDTIKGYKNGNTTQEEATIADASKSKTISVTKDQGGFNQGFKFTVGEDICLSTNSEKIATGDYEIKEEGGTWYLTKKETTTG